MGPLLQPKTHFKCNVAFHKENEYVEDRHCINFYADILTPIKVR